MKSHAIKSPTKNQEQKHQDCKVIPIYDFIDQGYEDSSKEDMGFDFDFREFYYFIPIALLIAIVYPIIYLSIVFIEVKNRTWVILKSIF